MSHCVHTSIGEIGERFAYVGFTAALCGNLVVACAMNILKHMAYVIPKPSDLDPQQTVLMPDRKSKWYWTGVAMKMCGETMILLANGFASSSVVAVICTMSGIFNAIFAVLFFNEKVSRNDLYGMGLIVSGTIIASLFGPGRGYNLGAEQLMEDLMPRAQAWAFMFCVFIALILALVAAKYWGETQLLAYVVVSSILTMVAVMATKAYASIAKLAYFNGQYFEQFGSVIPWVLFVVISVASGISALFLNRAVVTWGNREVIPVFVALSTFLILVGSATFYGEFECSDGGAIVLFSLAFCIATVGLFLVNVARSDKTLYTISAVAQLQPIRQKVTHILSQSSTLEPRPFTYKERAKAIARQLLFWPKFSAFYAGMILVNAMCFLYTTACYRCESYGTWLMVVEAIVNLILIAEVCIRYAATDSEFWSHKSNIFDLAVATANIVGFGLLVGLPSGTNSSNSPAWSITLGLFRDSFRALRLYVFIKNYRRLRRATSRRGDIGDIDMRDEMEEVDRVVFEEDDDTRPADEDVESQGGPAAEIPGKPPLPEIKSRGAVATNPAAEAWWHHVKKTTGEGSEDSKVPVLPSPPVRSPMYSASATPTSATRAAFDAASAFEKNPKQT